MTTLWEKSKGKPLKTILEYNKNHHTHTKKNSDSIGKLFSTGSGNLKSGEKKTINVGFGVIFHGNVLNVIARRTKKAQFAVNEPVCFYYYYFWDHPQKSLGLTPGSMLRITHLGALGSYEVPKINLRSAACKASFTLSAVPSPP